MGEKFNLARIKKNGKVFEVVINPEEALKFREAHGKEGNSVELRDAVRSDEIFYDAHKGLLASESELKDVFGMDNRDDIIKEIIINGEIQLTQEQRKEIMERKRKRIIHLIHSMVSDPKTHLPHPLNRIEMAMEQAKVHIKENKSAEDQVEDVIKAIRIVLPIKFEIKKIAVKIPANYAAKAYSVVKSIVKTDSEEWLGDGSLRITTTVPSAIEQDLYDKLNNLTHGSIETEVIEIKNK